MDDRIVFDTHRFIRRLVETGMDERTEEVLAKEQVSLLNSNLATKFQLAEVDLRLSKQITEVELRLSRQVAQVGLRITEVEARLSTRISEVEAGLLKKLAELETRLLKWMVGLLVAQSGLVVTLIKVL